MADRILLCGLLTAVNLLSVIVCVKAETTNQPETHNIIWSASVSTMYPASSPLDVKLGDLLNITCPPDATSNVWIQTDMQQYEMCNCTADGLENPDCSASITTRQVCQDEVLIAITSDSNDLNSALSFESGTTYYLISYSLGDKPLAGYADGSAGGECLDGYKMAMKVQPLALPTTTATTVATTTTDALPTTTATTVATTTTDGKDNLFTNDVGGIQPGGSDGSGGLPIIIVAVAAGGGATVILIVSLCIYLYCCYCNRAVKVVQEEPDATMDVKPGSTVNPPEKPKEPKTKPKVIDSSPTVNGKVKKDSPTKEENWGYLFD